MTRRPQHAAECQSPRPSRAPSNTPLLSHKTCLPLTSIEPFLIVDHHALRHAVSALNRSAGAENLHPLVVPERAPPRVLDDTKGAVLTDRTLCLVSRMGGRGSPLYLSSFTVGTVTSKSSHTEVKSPNKTNVYFLLNSHRASGF